MKIVLELSDNATVRDVLKAIFPNTVAIYHKETDRTTSFICSDQWLDSKYSEIYKGGKK